MYEFLADKGLRTTKSVWPLAGKEVPRIGGSTCEDPEYLRWTLNLQAQGFEIGYHLATYHTSSRDQTLRGLERFQELYGQFPRSMANHSGCDEGIYWGFDRLTGYRRLLYKQWMRLHGRGAHRGHRKGDPLFWGDICRDRIEYVRSFQFSDINTLAGCPMMPYHDPGRPFVNQWFASSEGAEINAFNRCVSEANQDRLEEEGGACIMYTHLASGFSEDGRVQARFAELMDRLSRKNGWFVPVNTLLDYIVEQRGPHDLLPAERRRLEHRWLAGKLKTGPS
ncbi:MAG: hypothetical protein VX956_00295 [Gemmatimonadota bacterium]|nr:hypothetical protein [Gemmatimonadota bacterium]